MSSGTASKHIVSHLVAALLGSAICWVTLLAAGALFIPQHATSSATPATVSVESGELSSTVTANAKANWAPTAHLPNGANGTITTIDTTPGSQVDEGTQLFSVDLRPAIAAEGTIPSFGDLERGASGAAVVQLQALLGRLGYWDYEPDGEFGAGFEGAVKAWQIDAGFAANGVVSRGDIIWFPSLPTRVGFDPGIVAIGTQVSAGQLAVTALGESPEFTIGLNELQTRDVEIGTAVSIAQDSVNEPWRATVASKEPAADQPGTVILKLSAVNSSEPICADECGKVPVGDPTLIPASIMIMPEQSGLVVPSAAIRSDANGKPVLIDTEGTRHPISVIANAHGQSLIEGVSEGFVAVLETTSNAS